MGEFYATQEYRNEAKFKPAAPGDSNGTGNGTGRRSKTDGNADAIRAALASFDEPQDGSGGSTAELAEALERTLTERAAGLYLAVMDDLTQQQCVKAFAAAAETCRYFPPPAVLRELGSPARPVDPAMAALRVVLEAMREFGPELREKLGPVLNDGRDEDGRCLPVTDWKRGPGVKPNLFPPATNATIARLGMGDFAAGLAEISRHPALRPECQRGHLEAPGRAFDARHREKLENRWTELYRGCC